MFPVGDKVVLEKCDLPAQEGHVLAPAGSVYARVVAVGKGIPFGRGEFYTPTVTPGDHVFIQDKEWEGAPVVRIRLGQERARQLRVVHERQILVQVEEEDL
jgi:co-chaperonin GroES (HSP10)